MTSLLSRSEHLELVSVLGFFVLLVAVSMVSVNLSICSAYSSGINGCIFSGQFSFLSWFLFQLIPYDRCYIGAFLVSNIELFIF